jgi:hypothetical protein
MLKVLFGVVCSVLLVVPCVAFIIFIFDPYISPFRLVDKLGFPILIGVYGSVLLILWHIVVSPLWRSSWSNSKKNGRLVATTQILTAFVLGFAVPTAFAFIASKLLTSSIYCAVAVALNAIPASIYVSLFVLGYLDEEMGEFAKATLTIIFVFLMFLGFLSSYEPFLLFPWLLAFEVVTVIALTVLVLVKLEKPWMVITMLVAWALLLVVSDHFISYTTERLYLDALNY